MCYYLCPSVIDLSDLLWIQLMAEIAILHTLSKLFYHQNGLSLDTGCVWLEGGGGMNGILAKMDYFIFEVMDFHILLGFLVC